MDSLTLSTASLASTSSTNSVKRLIPLDASLIDGDRSEVQPVGETYYRRQITPLPVEEAGQPEKIKDNKDAKNRDRQSGASLYENSYITSDMAISMRRPSAEKRAHRKGVAPMAVPPKRVLQMLPLQEIRQELEVIEIQHQGLEKQGVILEKMIRERCERPPDADNQAADPLPTDYPNSVDVDDLIMQLFEIVNEKNELFRRQAELMYLRRSHRLEQEQADLEYEIRKSMAQPERNKTDTDKTREENLIARLVEVVQQRNEVIECLEMDRVREREEDTVS
jgi:MICAL-like protein 1